MVTVCVGLTPMVAGQTCPRPVAECSGTLYCGGEWDFEAGFYFTAHHLAGQSDGPPAGGNVSTIPADKWAHVAVGWKHWVSFPTWTTGGYWGTCSFNENKNCDNVYRGDRSQELTMTCANGVGVIYKSAAVPTGHRIRVEAYMKFTPNGDAPDVDHAIGLDPSGGTNPESTNVQWTTWQEQTPSPPQLAGVFNKGAAETVSLGTMITVFIRQRAFEPPCEGQTFMIDNVRVLDLGPDVPVIPFKPGDFDGDGDVDQVDFGLFQQCIRDGGINLQEESCLAADLNGDLIVDINDFDIFWDCLSGYGVPSDPACAG